MNKHSFVFSLILIVIGVVTLLQTTVINQVMPKIGLVAFQAAMAGSYNPNDYHINFWGVNIAAIGMIIIGFIGGYVCYRSEKR